MNTTDNFDSFDDAQTTAPQIDDKKVQKALVAMNPAGLNNAELCEYHEIRRDALRSLVESQIKQGMTTAEAVAEEIETAERNGDVQTIPMSILRPPGLVGEVMDWILETAGSRQPKFSAAAALTVCGALLGRGVKDYTGQRTNIYTLAVGNTSAGKNDPIKAVQLIVRETGQTKLLEGEVTSDSALELLLAQFPVRLLCLDEVGHYFANIRNAGQNNGYLKSVIPMLTKAWSAAAGILIGKTRATDKDGKWSAGKQIDNPCLCVYGTTVPGVLFQSMSEGDFADGSIPRFVCFISETRPRFNPQPEAKVPDELKAKINRGLLLLGIKRHGTKTADGKPDDVPTAMLIPESEKATRIFDSFETRKARMLEQADNGDVPCYLYGKIVENARRVALIVAAFRNPQKPIVDETDAKYAVNLLAALTEELVQKVHENVSSSKAEQTKKVVLLTLRKHNGRIDKSALVRETRSLRKQEREEALQDLIDGEEIVDETVKGTTKSTHVYHLTDKGRTA